MNSLQILMRICLILLASLLASASRASADGKKILRHATEDMAENITRLNLKKIYVHDFLDTSVKRTDRSAFWGAAFSKALSELSSNLEVLNRGAVQKSYENLRITTADLQNPEALVRIGQANGAHAVILGTVTESSSHSLRLDLSIRDSGSGKELFGNHYELSNDKDQGAFFPALSDPRA